MEKFQKATSKAYGCLLVDLKQDTPDPERLKSGNVFGEEVQLQGGGGGGQSHTKPPGIPAYPNIEQQTIKGENEREEVHLQGGGQPPNTAPVVKTADTTKAQEDIEVDRHISESQDVNRQDTTNTCTHCGVLFQTPYFLNIHQQKGCVMQNDDDSDEDADERPWAGLVQLAYDKHKKLYGEKIEALEEEGMSEKEAAHQTSQALMPKYRHSLMQIYKIFLGQMHDLSKNSQHKEIMMMVKWYMEWKGYNFEKALDITLRKKRHVFQAILDEEEEEEITEGSEEAEEEDEANESDKDEDDLPLSELQSKSTV